MANRMRKKDTVKGLRQKNRRLAKENHLLKKALHDREEAAPSQQGQTESFGISERIEEICHDRKQNFLMYLLSIVRASFLYGLWMRVWTYVRRYRMTILIVQIFLFLFSLPGNGAWFLALSALFATVFPVLLVLLVVLSQTASLRRRREKRALSLALKKGRPVYVFKLTKKDFPKNVASFLSLISAVTRTSRATVLLVSPFLFSRKGLAPRPKAPYYVAARQEAPYVFLLRSYYYFSLRRSLRDSRQAVFY